MEINVALMDVNYGYYSRAMKISTIEVGDVNAYLYLYTRVASLLQRQNFRNVIIIMLRLRFMWKKTVSTVFLFIK